MRQVATAATILFLMPSVASAHAVGVEAKLKDGTVTVEAFFDDDTPAAEAKVVVVDESGRTVLEGKADQTGKWSFAAPPPGKYKINVDAGAGHKVEFTVSEGVSRAEFTGSMRWVWAAAGVAGIGLATWFLTILWRARYPAEPRQ
jgi:hypothetical protein